MLISLHTSIYASDHDACEINPILKSLVNKNPNEEAIDQYNQGRLIYLGIYSYNLEAPGVNADPYCLKDNDKCEDGWQSHNRNWELAQYCLDIMCNKFHLQ